ncbi:MAG: glycoside hydrolase family 15 protein [Pyrinomonadaceae bacterium]
MRDIPVGNGSLLIAFDDRYQIRDIYFPHVGQENHTDGAPSRFGVWVDGEFSWTSSDEWQRSLCYLPETLVTDVRLTNARLGIAIVASDAVASHENVFLRRISIRNLRDQERSIRVFLHQDLRIYENKVGDAVYYDPETAAIVHYQRDRYFLFATRPHFESFATGRKDFGAQEGTWRDAEDGELAGGVITEGSVDSTVGVHLYLGPQGETEMSYWIAAGKCHADVARLNSLVLKRGPAEYLDYTANYWRAWVNKNDVQLDGLPIDVVDLYKRSLLIARTQVDNGGAILAANDSDVVLRASDHYSYLWPRDGAFVAHAFDRAGFAEVTRRFFHLCADIVHPNGYFLQKYNPDGTVASGWHAAWDPRRKVSLVPIQQDETALVLWALWEHYRLRRDIDFAHQLYTTLVKPCADFMVAFRDDATGLPLPSWNLWEDRRGVHTFTCSTVVAGLRAAANFAHLFAEHGDAEAYREAAGRMVEAMALHLYDEKLGRFVRGLLAADDGGPLERDTTIDASLFGLFYFGCFDVRDKRVESTMKAVEDALYIGTAASGVARFERDSYMRRSDAATGNVWFICTLWLAEYYIAAAGDAADLARPLEMLRSVARSARTSGVLAEQMDPATGEHVSVSPLTWSHSTFVAAVHSYLDKQAELDKSGPPA